MAHAESLAQRLVRRRAGCGRGRLRRPIAQRAGRQNARSKPRALAPPGLPRRGDARPMAIPISGADDVATTAPLEAACGTPKGRPTLTDEEAAAAEAYDRQHEAQDAAPISGYRQSARGRRRARRDQDLARTGRAICRRRDGRAQPVSARAGPGTRQSRRTNAAAPYVVDPPERQDAADEGRAGRRIAGCARPPSVRRERGGYRLGPPGAFDGPESRPLAERCLLGFNRRRDPPSLPNYFYNNLKQIVQTADTVLILNEMVHDARVVASAQHVPRPLQLDGPIRSAGGTATRSSWTTTNFTARRSSTARAISCTSSNASGAPTPTRCCIASPSRIHRRGIGHGPASIRGRRPRIRSTSTCHEGNYAMGGMLRGARQKEAEDAAKKQE